MLSTKEEELSKSIKKELEAISNIDKELEKSSLHIDVKERLISERISHRAQVIHLTNLLEKNNNGR